MNKERKQIAHRRRSRCGTGEGARISAVPSTHVRQSQQPVTLVQRLERPLLAAMGVYTYTRYLIRKNTASQMWDGSKHLIVLVYGSRYEKYLMRPNV